MRLCSLGEIGHLRLARTRGMGRNILFSWDGLMGVQRVTPAANAKMTSRSLQRFRKEGVGLEMSLYEKSCLAQRLPMRAGSGCDQIGAVKPPFLLLGRRARAGLLHSPRSTDREQSHGSPDGSGPGFLSGCAVIRQRSSPAEPIRGLES